MNVALRSVVLPASLALAAALAACSSNTTIQTRGTPTSTTEDPTDPEAPTDSTTPTDPTQPKKPGETTPTDPTTPTPMSDTPNIITTMMPTVAAALAKGNVDVTKLPASMSSLTSKQRSAVMSSFVAALGGNCATCHASASDFSTNTPKMNVTRKMWSVYVKGFTLASGAAVYCDTCHQGQVEFLDRKSGDAALGNWMKANFVDGLAQANHATNNCASCHGTPFSPSILDAWEN